MAEVVIGGIAGKVVTSLVPQALEKVGKFGGIKHELEVHRGIVSTLCALLDLAEEQYHQNSQTQDWVERLKDAFYDAQDVLEEFNIEARRRELRGHNEMIKEVRTFFSSSNQLAFIQKISRKVRAMRQRMESIRDEKRIHLGEQSMDSRGERKRTNIETCSLIHEENIIGRVNDRKKVMKFLLDLDVRENVSILPIVGIGGFGKTALARLVYNDKMVNDHFDLKMWVCVSNDFDKKKIVKNIIACAKEEEPKDGAMERLQSELRTSINGRRYLLVLDDLWDVETWEDLKTLLVGGAKGSKILITTRLPLVAKITCFAPPLVLKGLSKSASLKLLMQMAGRKEEGKQDLDLLAIGKEIVRKCSRVPLVIRTIGRLLSSMETTDEWLRFKDNELSEVSKREDRIISVLRLSYNHLPLHLKQCFALCSLFPKDYEIKKQTLVNLWMAAGFIHSSNKSQNLEDIAHGYFMSLLRQNFFQEYKKNLYGEETCKMHDLMHDLACLVAGTECWVAWGKTKSIHERTRHLSYRLTSNLMGDISHLKGSPLRTIFSTYEETAQSGPTSKVDLRQLIQSFKRLRIMDLHHKKIKKVPRSICKLKHLTYLDLSYNDKLKRLPNSITRLHNLQTLNLNGCCVLEELPRGIRKLVSLRNLAIDYCHKLSYVPRGLGQLSSLHRLTRFILPKKKAIAKNYCSLEELNGLSNLRGSLCIENLGSVTNAIVESKAANLIEKQSLESLTFEWGDFDTDDVVTGNRDKTLLGGLRPHLNLQKLSIKGYRGESFPTWMMDGLGSSLPKLDEVSFSDCRRCKHLPPLGQLSHLKSLVIRKLTEVEYIKSDHSSTASFPSLSTLSISFCEKLTAMPLTPHLEELSLNKANPELIKMVFGLNKLRSLEISCMDSLEGLTEGCLKSLTSLESLEISYCPRLTSLALGVPHVSNLVKFGISNYEELDLSKDESGNILDFQGLHSLRSVDIRNLPKLASLPRWLLQASNLERLLLRECEELDISKDESGNILDFQGLQSLRSVEIDDLPKLASLPRWLLQLSNLERLSLYGCEELDISKDESDNILYFQGLQNLRSVKIYRLPKLASLPRWLLQLSNLERLEIINCNNLKELPEQIEALQSLQELQIRSCPSLTSLPQGMLGLPSLAHLEISYCEELDLSKDEKGNILNFQGLQSLRSVFIDGLPQLASLPPWLLQLSNLERLRIWNCDNLKALPEQIEALQSLKGLFIEGCHWLTSLPEGMQRLASLTHLQIYDCPDLEKRCKKDAGEDWYKIAHIPNITHELNFP